MKVMIADDEIPILDSTRMLLESIGYEVVTTGRADRILPVLQAARPHVLLQDVRMPGMDVAALMARIRRLEGARVPVVLFSASTNLPALGAEVGADGILEKPFTPTELLAVIEDAVAPDAAGGHPAGVGS